MAARPPTDGRGVFHRREGGGILDEKMTEPNRPNAPQERDVYCQSRKGAGRSVELRKEGRGARKLYLYQNIVER